jgi:hypothetical protein
MLKSTVLIALSLIVCCCSKHPPQAADSKKAILVSEQIIDKTRCNSFKYRLISPSVDGNTIDEIYHNAAKAHCIKNAYLVSA